MTTHRLLRAAPLLLVLFAIAALADEGDLDPTFSGDGLRTSDFHYLGGQAELAAGRDGRVFLAGSRLADEGADFSVTRLNAAGGNDNSYGLLGTRTVSYPVVGGADYVHAVFALEDGSVLVAGSVDTDPQAPTSIPNALLKLDADGDIDTGFGDAGWVLLPDTPFSAYYTLSIAAARTRDGSIVFAGMCFDCGAPDVTGLTVLRVSPQGVPDTSFGEGGWAVALFPGDVSPKDVVVDARGRVVVVADERVPDDFGSDTTIGLLLRFTASGERDTEFGEGGITYFDDLPRISEYESIYALAAAADVDGTLLVAVDGYDRAGLVRLDDSGRIDRAFGVDGLADVWRESGVSLSDIVVRGDGRLLASGQIRDQSGGADMFIARLHADGSRDNGFAGNGLLRVDVDPEEEDHARRMVLTAGRPLLAGPTGLNLRTTSLVRLASEFVFGDGLE